MATCCHNKLLIFIHCIVLTVILKHFVLLLELKHNGISSIKIKLTGCFLWPKWGVFTNWILKCDWDKFSALIGGLSLRRSWFIPGLVLLGFRVDNLALEVDLFRGHIFACNYHSTNPPYSSSATWCSDMKDKRTNLLDLQRRKRFRKPGVWNWERVGGAFFRRVLSLFSSLKD